MPSLGQIPRLPVTVSDISPTLTELRKQSDTLDRWLVQYAEGLDDDSLSETIDFVFTDGQPGCMSRVEMLMHVVTHGLFHMSVTSQILAKAGMPVSPVLATSYVRERDARCASRSLVSFRSWIGAKISCSPTRKTY